MYNRIFALLVLFLVFTTSATQNCPPNPSVDRLTTATHTFQLNPFNSRTQCYISNLDTFFANSQPQLITGIQNIANFQQDNNGLDFSLRSTLLSGNTQASFTLIINNGSWSTVSISYMVVARPQFLVGNYLSDANQLAACQKQQPYNLAILLSQTQTIQTTQSLAVLVFINGLRTPSVGFSLQFSQPSFDSNLKQINVSVITNANREIELIYFSYILVNLDQLSAAGYTYTFALNTVTADFVATGIVGINTANPSVKIANFGINKANALTCVGFTCNSCQSSASCQALGGQVVGNQCVKCSGGQVFVNGAGCSCNTGQYIINGACGICPSGTTYNFNSQSCQTTCGPNSILSGSTCICSPGFFNISGTCSTCPSGTNYNPVSQLCVSICGINSQLIGQTCVCSQGFFNISGICQTCPLGLSYSSISQSCIGSCGSNQIWSGNQCQCIAGFTMIGSQCLQTTAQCGTNKVMVSGICKCLSHLLEYQGSCYNCPANSAVTPNQSGCMCFQGYTLSSAFTCVLSNGNIVQSVSGTSSAGTSTSTTSISSSNSGSGSSTSSGNSGTVNIYGGSTTNTNSGTSTGSTTTTTTTGSSSSGSSSSTGTTFYNGASGCPTGAYYFNGTCRGQATISSKQSVIIVNAVYVNIIGANLPDTLTSNSCTECSKLIVAYLLNSPSNVQVSINYIPSTSYQWVAAIAYQGSPFDVVLQLRFNPIYSTHFTTSQSSSVFSIPLKPSQIPVYSLPSQTLTATNSLQSQDDLLTQSQEASIPPKVLEYFSTQQ